MSRKSKKRRGALRAPTQGDPPEERNVRQSTKLLVQAERDRVWQAQVSTMAGTLDGDIRIERVVCSGAQATVTAHVALAKPAPHTTLALTAFDKEPST